MGVRREFLKGKTRQELTFVVKDPDLYKIVTAWPKLKPQLARSSSRCWKCHAMFDPSRRSK